MLYRNMYWLLYILDMRFVLFLCTTAVWQFAINEYEWMNEWLQQIIYFCTFFVCVHFFSVSICVLCFFLLWAASYDGLMPSLAACHCNNWYVYVMYMLNKLSLSLLCGPTRDTGLHRKRRPAPEKILQWSSLPTAIGFGAGCTLYFFSFWNINCVLGLCCIWVVIGLIQTYSSILSDKRAVHTSIPSPAVATIVAVKRLKRSCWDRDESGAREMRQAVAPSGWDTASGQVVIDGQAASESALQSSPTRRRRRHQPRRYKFLPEMSLCKFNHAPRRRGGWEEMAGDARRWSRLDEIWRRELGSVVLCCNEWKTARIWSATERHHYIVTSSRPRDRSNCISAVGSVASRSIQASPSQHVRNSKIRCLF